MNHRQDRITFQCLWHYVLVLHLSLAFVGEAAATPESRAAVLFLLISPSSRVNGMGEAGVALADEPGGYYNPAAPALVARHHLFAATFYRDPLPWLPTLADDLEYSYSAFQLGWNSRAWSRRFHSVAPTVSRPFSFSVALSLYRTELDLGTQVRTDERGNASFDKADNYVFSVGAHYLLDLGFGFTVKKITSSLGDQGAGIERGLGEAKATAYDIGLLARLPLVDLADHATGRELTIASALRPVIDLSTGIAWNNRGDDLVYIDASQPDPLPSNRAAGWAGTLGLQWQVDKWRLDLVKLTFTAETYTPQIDGTDNAGAADNRRGYEISLAETLDIRRGKFDDDDGEFHLDTEGLTLKSDGLFKYIFAHPRMADGKSRLSRLAGHVSISWTKFKVDSGRDSPVLRGDDVVQIAIRL